VDELLYKTEGANQAGRGLLQDMGTPSGRNPASVVRDALALPQTEAAQHFPAPAHGGHRETAQPAQSIADRLLSEPFAFGFFQAVRLLERSFPERAAVGRNARPSKEVVRFHAHLSLSFPPSEIYELAQG